MAVRLIDPVRPSTARVGEVIIPAKRLRECGSEFQDDSFYVRSSIGEADRIRAHCELREGSKILDLGCGGGRLAIGLLSSTASVTYVGVDVNRRSIAWCRRHIGTQSGNFRFVELDVANDRYNPGGRQLMRGYRLPFDDSAFDIVYAYSLFSHLMPDHAVIYLSEVARVLKMGGTAFMTAFVSDEGPDCVVNPPGRNWSGPLHCVLFRLDHWVAMIREAGLEVKGVERGTETDGQSAFYLSKRPPGFAE